VEAQATFTFKIATDADTDGDGLQDVYDVSVNLFGGGGITPFDFDGDGVPDFRDSDTDNDGAPDINEASKYFQLDQTNINTTDTDGDGLLDEFDNLDIRTLTSGNRFRNVSSNNMGLNGSFDGPIPSGTNVKMVRSLQTGDRDWRSTSVLPLQIVHFGGVLSDRTANLVWKVENESEIKEYQLERSVDGRQFETIATVKATNPADKVYNYKDDLSAYVHPRVYYRLRQVNRAGEVYLSNIISFVLEASSSSKLSVYPVPFRTVINLKLKSVIKDEVMVTLFDMGGQVILRKKFSADIGLNTYSIPMEKKISDGTYILLVQGKDQTWSEKIIKQ
jgi:hypothetical protein